MNYKTKQPKIALFFLTTRKLTLQELLQKADGNTLAVGAGEHDIAMPHCDFPITE